jgi:hypothetical protein
VIAIPNAPETYTFDDVDDLYQTANALPTVEEHAVYAHHTERDEWEEWPYRDSLWTDDGRVAGVVSSNDDFYNVIQYGDILEAVGNRVEYHQDDGDIDVAGQVTLSPSAHKMSATVTFDGDGTTVYAGDDDPVDLGLKVRSGHSGFHGVQYDVGAERKVCSNGMMAFVADYSFDQTHQEAFQPELAHQAVDAIIDGTDTVEQRITDAQDRTLLNQDEALLVLLDAGIGDYLEQPVPDLLNALNEEVSDPANPTLWETYNAATRALTHYTGETPTYELDTGYEQAAELLETGDSTVPEAEELGRQTVEQRANQLIEEDNAEPYWDGEAETVRELLATHNEAT